jgi:hypothetical protein
MSSTILSMVLEATGLLVQAFLIPEISFSRLNSSLRLSCLDTIKEAAWTRS